MAAETAILSDQASRLKKLRLYLGLTRKNFEIKFGISRHTLRAWEIGEKRFTDNAIKRVVDLLNSNGINCSFEWFLSGMGDSPIMLKESIDYASSIDFDPVNEKTLNEVLFFKQNNPGLEVLVVGDDRFEPLAHIGDYIGLKQVDVNELDLYLESLAYVRCVEGEKFLSIITKTNTDYIFESLDKQKSVGLEVVEFIKIIVWFKKLMCEEN